MPQKSIKLTQSGWLVAVIKIGLYACLFMPLIIGDQFIFPFIFPKQAFFQIVVEIIFGLYLFLALRQPQFRPRSSWLWRAILAYFAVIILSSVFGLNTYHSFWSNYERMAGVISLLHYLAFLFVAVNILKTQDDWYRFFDFSIIASVLEALYGVGQLVGVKAFIHGSGGRIDGTIGNPAFLAGYMLINALFALWLLLEKKQLGWRIFYIGAIIVNLFVLYQSQTRGAAIALVLSLFVLSLFFIFAPGRVFAQLPWRQPLRLKKYAIGFLIFIFLVIGSIWFGRDSDFVKNRPTLLRLTHISTQEATSQTRLMAWQMSLKGFREHPIFGWGLENYYVLFNKYYNPNLYPVESWFDRSHNAYLDVLVHTGLVGAAIYGAIFILVFWYLWRAWRQGKIKYYTAVIFTVILLAYGIQNLFVFDTQVTLLMIYLILAFIVFLSFSSTGETVGQPAKPNYFFAGLVFLLVSSSLYFFNIKPGLASTKGIDALLLLQAQRLTEGVNKFKEAYEVGTFGLPEVATRAMESAIQLAGRAGGEGLKPEEKELLLVAIEGMERTLRLEPLNARYMMMLGNLYLTAAQSDSAYLAQVDSILSAARKLSPTRQELLFALGQLHLFQGKTSEVLPLFKEAMELNDKVALSHWNYGIMAVALGEKELGEAEIEKAKEMGRSLELRDIQLLINAYNQTNDWEKIVSLYQEWIALSPDDATPYAGLAATYARMGKNQKAKEAALKAAEINPDFRAEAEQFIESLGL